MEYDSIDEFAEAIIEFTPPVVYNNTSTHFENNFTHYAFADREGQAHEFLFHFDDGSEEEEEYHETIVEAIVDAQSIQYSTGFFIDNDEGVRQMIKSTDSREILELADKLLNYYNPHSIKIASKNGYTRVALDAGDYLLALQFPEVNGIEETFSGAKPIRWDSIEHLFEED